ncbi:MAG: hypothetical protein OES46_05245 [Gammaproteobacteria bacterium]|nr:hypothetical protein [Gammaproteobacteria bacterium]
MNAETLILIGGLYNLALAVFHLLFWKLFNWKQDLASLTPLNRAVVQILNLCLTFVFLVFAYISFFHANELLHSKLGRSLLALMAIFWFLRAIEQIIFFGLRRKASIAFLILFLIGTGLYSIPLIDQALRR